MSDIGEFKSEQSGPKCVSSESEDVENAPNEDSAIENSVSQESSVVELSNSVRENSASQESSDSTKKNSTSQESSVVELSESSQGSEETLSAKETESLMENSDSEDHYQTISTIQPETNSIDASLDENASQDKTCTQKRDDSKDEPVIEGTTEESKGVNEEGTKTDESNVRETIVKEPALETEDSNADDDEKEKMDMEMVEEKTTNEEKCENSRCEEKSENLSGAENTENPLNEENNYEMEVDEDSTSSAKPEMEVDDDLSVDESTSAETSEVHQKEDVSACTDEPEIEVIDDTSGKKSLDSETTDMKSDDNASEKDVKKEEEIEVTVDDSAKESMDSETLDMEPIDNASGNGAKKEKVLFIPIDLEEDPGEYQDFTAQEIMDYLEKKINEYMTNPEINDLMRVQLESVQLRDQVRAKMEEMNRLQAFMEKINRDQEKLLRHYGVIPKLPTKDVAVFVDMPALDTSSNLHSNNVKEQIQKNEQLTLTPCGTSPKGISATNIAGGASVLKKSPVSKKDGPVECIDLTDEMDAPSNKTIIKAPSFKTYSMNTHQSPIKSPNTLHPAPLPIMPNRVNRYLKEAPPKPRVKISCDDKGIILQWDADITDRHEKLQCFEIFGYQEQKTQNVTSALWKRIGSVKTLSLPMACTLTKFVPGNNYHFTVRGLDIHNRPGIFSEPVSTRFDPLPKKS